MKRLLAQSEHFKIVSDYEYVDLVFNKPSLFRSRDNIYIGDFYGDPTCALISRDEKYLVVGGNGLIIYYLREPYSSYHPDAATDQYKELFREPDQTWWIETLYQSDLEQDWKYFRAVVNVEVGVSVFIINAETGETLKLDCV